MLDELAPAITFPMARPGAAKRSGPLGWRLAAPLIGSASIVLWMLIGKAIMLLIA
jgi:hypothetical protein